MDCSLKKYKVDDGEWHQLTIDWGHGFVRFYVDGALARDFVDPQIMQKISTRQFCL